MTIIHTLVFTVAAFASTASIGAFAHVGGHDDDEKLMPATCAQLNDKERYTDDVSYPEIKALQERCDVEQKDQSEAGETTEPLSSKKGN